MQRPRLVMDHAASHWDGVLEHFIGDTELFERVNAARRKREINRSPADDVSFTRISPALVKIHIVSAPPQIRGKQSAREAATDQNKFRHSEES